MAGETQKRSTAPRPNQCEFVRIGANGCERNTSTEGFRWLTQPIGLHTVANRKEAARMEERKLPGLDSNQDKENQNLLCYRYTTGY